MVVQGHSKSSKLVPDCWKFIQVLLPKNTKCAVFETQCINRYR